MLKNIGYRWRIFIGSPTMADFIINERASTRAALKGIRRVYSTMRLTQYFPLSFCNYVWRKLKPTDMRGSILMDGLKTNFENFSKEFRMGLDEETYNLLRWEAFLKLANETIKRKK